MTLEVVLGIIGVIFNLLLLAAQYRCKPWAIYERILVYQVTFTNAAACLTNVVVSIVRITCHVIYLDFNMPATRWMIIPENACEVVVILTLNTLARHCCRTLRRFYEPATRTKDKGRAMIALVIIWMVSLTAAVTGFAPRSEGGLLNGWVPTRVMAYICLIILLASTAVDFRTSRRLNKRLQADFVLRQAQQRLDSRVQLKDAERFTSTMFPILLTHIGLSLCNWTIDFVMDIFVISGLMADPQYASFVAAVCTVVIHSAASNLFGVAYPALFLWRHRKTRQVIHGWIRKSQSSVEVFTSAGSSVIFPPYTGVEQRDHFRKLEEHWETFAALTKTKAWT